eukprot:g3981.t1
MLGLSEVAARRVNLPSEPLTHEADQTGTVGPGPAAYAPDHNVLLNRGPAYFTAGRGNLKSRSIGPGPGYYGPPRSTLRGKEKLEAAAKTKAKAAPAGKVSPAAFNGEWVDEDGMLVTINSMQMLGPDGVEIQVQFPAANTIAFCPGAGARFEGKLQGLSLILKQNWLTPRLVGLDLESRSTANVAETASGAYMLIDGRGSGPVPHVTDGSLIWIGPHATGGTVMGALEPEEHWLQAELASASGDIVGHIRLFYDEQAREEAKGLSLCFIRGEEDAVISNFKNIQSPDWGRDIMAKKGGDEEVLTTLAGQWLSISTATPVTDVEEEESCYDPLCNKRGKCQRCSCQIFVMSEHLLGQELEDVCCRRCGCSVAHHAKVGKFRLNGKVASDAEPKSRASPGPPAKSPMDEIPSRQWVLDDAGDQDPVEFIIQQLESAKNLYEVLGVSPSASALAIRQAYRAISLRVHPDKITDSDERGWAALAEDAFKLASSAYEVLNDELERKAYDRELRAEYLRTKPKAKPKPKSVDEFFKNPSIGTFMNSPYYGEDGVFGTSGTIKENAAVKQLEEEMAKTGHIPPHLWPQGLFPQGNTFSVNTGPAWAGFQQHQADQEKKRQASAAEPNQPGGEQQWVFLRFPLQDVPVCQLRIFVNASRD